MPNQVITPKNQAFQTLAELDKPVKDYFFCLKEIQALHNAVIYFIGKETNQHFKNATKTVHSTLYGSMQILNLWLVQLDKQTDAISDIAEIDNPTSLIHAIYNDFQKLDADVQHLMNLAKIACDELLQTNPKTFQIAGIELGVIQFMTDAIKRMTTQLHSDIFSECDVLGELYPTIFKAGV